MSGHARADRRRRAAFCARSRTSLRGAGDEVDTATNAEEALTRIGARAARGDHPRPRAARPPRHRGLPRAAQLERDPGDRRLGRRRGATRRSRRSTRAPTTTSPSRSGSASCSRGCASCCAVRRSSGSPVISGRRARVDLDKHAAWVAGERVHLTPREFDLLRLLRPEIEGKLLTHRAILRGELWGPAYPGGSRATCTSTSPSCAARSSRTRHAPTT